MLNAERKFADCLELRGFLHGLKDSVCGGEPVGDPTHLSQAAVTHHLSPCVDLCADLTYLLIFSQSKLHSFGHLQEPSF